MDLSYNKLYDLSKSCGFSVDLLWICCTAFRFVEDFSICCGFFVESTTNPQHLDMSRCCGFVVDLSKSCGFAVDLL
jgi:hypothetical protein